MGFSKLGKIRRRRVREERRKTESCLSEKEKKRESDKGRKREIYKERKSTSPSVPTHLVRSHAVHKKFTYIPKKSQILHLFILFVVVIVIGSRVSCMLKDLPKISYIHYHPGHVRRNRLLCRRDKCDDLQLTTTAAGPNR